MSNRHILASVGILIALVLAACQGELPQIVKETPCVPHIIEVTRMVPQTTDIDPDYFDGIIVITQYYTFLGNGLYEQAYRLLSASAQSARSLEDYIEMASHAFKAVEIDSIQPYYIAVEHQGGQITPDPSNKKRFALQIRSWGEGNASGSQPNGVLQDLFLGLVLEDGKWKIDSFATAPLP